MKTVSLLVFDLDDTLVAFDIVTEPSWRQVCGAHYRKEGFPDAASLYEAIRRCSGWYWSDPRRHAEGRLSIEAARRSIVRMAFGDLGLTNTPAADEIADDYSRIRMENIFLLPGVHETLGICRGQQYSTAILTNGDSRLQRNKIDRFDLAKYFDDIFIEEERGVGKPHPQAFKNVLIRFGLEPRQAMMIGDNYDWEIAVPKLLGMRTVWFNFDGRKKLPDEGVRPDFILEDFTEIPRILQAV